MTTKILQKAAEKTGRVMTENEIKSFLQGTLNLHLATIDQKGEPNIQPVWFYHDPENQKIFFSTYADSKKMKNMQQNPTVYFSIDEDKFPYRCVKGKAIVSISEDISKNIPIVEKICLKQIGSLDDPFSQLILETAKKGDSFVVEISPKFYSTWDMSGESLEH